MTEKTTTTLSGKVLIMDDEDIIRDALREILQMKGLEVDTAADGNKAVELYKDAFEKEAPFTIVIMDLTIPGGMGGLETLAELQKIDPEVKAIVSSGYSTDPVVVKCQEYGFCGMLPKPFKSQDLLKTLKDHL